MGTHPIFESDFDCLTERRVWPTILTLTTCSRTSSRRPSRRLKLKKKKWTSQATSPIRRRSDDREKKTPKTANRENARRARRRKAQNAPRETDRRDARENGQEKEKSRKKSQNTRDRRDHPLHDAIGGRGRDRPIEC